jgi:secreted PhoX family phosphatase
MTGNGISRRRLLKGGAALGLSLALPRAVLAAANGDRAGLRADRVGTAAGFVHDVVLRWGDPLFPGAPALDAAAAARGGLLEMRPGLAARWFGYNCDAVHFFPLEGNSSRGLACVNHEYTNEELFLPGIASMGKASPAEVEAYVRLHPSVVALTQAMHGVSVAVIERGPGGDWRHAMDAGYARRITANSPCSITGPARNHPLLSTAADPAATMVLGTLANCAGGQTPWGTFLTAEENVQDYFGGAAALERADPRIREAHRRLPPRAASIHGWEHVEPRFDLGQSPTELLRFGWIVEIDPYDPTATPRKRTALGRFQHECAASAMTRDGRLAVYSGDDSRFEYVYKFVTASRVHPTDRSANRDLLDRGTLYAARFNDDGSGEWLALRHGDGPLVAANGFSDQGDVVIRARAAADLLGATPMDRPEDIAPDGATGRVFISLTNNALRRPGPTQGESGGRQLDLGPNAANPRGPNEYGHVMELVEEDADTAATRFAWRIFLFGGEAQAGDPLGSPDNLDLDQQGNLWVVTDGKQPGGGSNGCFRVPTSGAGAGVAQQVLSAPPGSEVAGCAFVPDGKALLLSIQHPGEGGHLARTVSTWPDGPGHLPRPSLIALRREDGGAL